MFLGQSFYRPIVESAYETRIQDMYWFTIKVSFFMYHYLWYRGTFLRNRFDQLRKLGWKLVSGIAGVLVLTALVGIRQETMAVLSGILQ